MTQVMCIQPPRRERRRGGRGIERESEGGEGERKRREERKRAKEGVGRPGMRQVKEKRFVRE